MSIEYRNYFNVLSTYEDYTDEDPDENMDENMDEIKEGKQENEDEDEDKIIAIYFYSFKDYNQNFYSIEESQNNELTTKLIGKNIQIIKDDDKYENEYRTIIDSIIDESIKDASEEIKKLKQEHEQNYTSPGSSGVCSVKMEGQEYTGGILNGKRHGKGKYIWRNGDSYEGEWENGLMHGNGVYKWHNGDVYTGTFSNNKMHGKGIKHVKDSIYEGDFVNEIKQGTGKVTFMPQGDAYIGEYFNNTRNGYGKYEWKNGDVYEGYWEDGLVHGRGTYYHSDGSVFKGEWYYSRRTGPGILTKTNGMTFNVLYNNGKCIDRTMRAYIPGKNLATPKISGITMSVLQYTRSKTFKNINFPDPYEGTIQSEIDIIESESESESESEKKYSEDEKERENERIKITRIISELYKLLDTSLYENVENTENNNLYSSIKGKDNENNLCIICCEKDRNCVFVDCNHVCSCMDCSKKLKKCPLCRSEITNVIRLIHS